jgi:hypothetical protein
MIKRQTDRGGVREKEGEERKDKCEESWSIKK